MRSLRIYIIVLLLCASCFLLLSPIFFGRNGVAVIGLRTGGCGDLAEGDVITQVSGKPVRNSAEFGELEAGVKSGVYYPMVVNNGPGGCVALGEGDSGIDVSDMESSRLRFDKTIAGGVEIIVKPESEVSAVELESARSIIQSRMEILGMSDGVAETSNGRIAMSSSPNSKIGMLLERGKLESEIAQSLTVSNAKAEVKIGSNRYGLTVMDGKIVANGSEIATGGNFYLENIRFTFVNYTNTSVSLNALIFDNGDVLGTLSEYGSISSESGGYYRFTLPVEIDEASGRRFGVVSDGLGTVIVGDQTSLNGVLVFYIDGEKLSELRIPADSAGIEIKNINIMGFSTSMNAVVMQRTRVKLALAGELPSEFEIESVSAIPATNPWIIWSVPLAVALVFLVFAAMKRNMKACALLSGAAAVEAALVFGGFAVVQNFTSWSIDSYALIGVCAALVANALDEIVFKSRAGSARKLKWLLLAIPLSGFAMLFTFLRGFGIALLLGIAVNRILTGRISKSVG